MRGKRSSREKRDPKAVNDTDSTHNPHPEPLSEGGPTSDFIYTDLSNAVPFARLPPELFDEIISYFPVLPPTFYADTAPVPIPPLYHRQRTDVLRTLSQSCRSLRQMAFPRLWRRLDVCFVPESSSGSWYQFCNANLQKKAEGVINSGHTLQNYIRTLSFTLSKRDLSNTLPPLRSLLEKLPNLHTIHIISCKSPGDLARAITSLHLPSVRTLLIPSDTHSLIRACPNVNHIQCVGGNGHPMIGSLKQCRCEVLDGMIDWINPMLAERLAKTAPHLKKLELRRPVNWGLGILSQNTAPSQWADVIPKFSALPNLVCLQLTFPGETENRSDLDSIAAARKVLRESKVKGEKKLIIRRVIAPHYTNTHEEDFVHSHVEEIFE